VEKEKRLGLIPQEEKPVQITTFEELEDYLFRTWRSFFLNPNSPVALEKKNEAIRKLGEIAPPELLDRLGETIPEDKARESLTYGQWIQKRAREAAQAAREAEQRKPSNNP
jgi:hypothetical protein